MTYELFQTVQVLAVQLNIVVACAFDPKGLDRFGAFLVDAEAVRKVNHLVFGAVND
jgi:hypothetical protein